MDLKGRDFLTLKDFSCEEIEYLIDLAAELKEKKHKGIVEQPLVGKNVALIFEKTSTRTRCSFEVAAHDLGMGTTYLDPAGSQEKKKVLLTLHECLPVCMMELSIEVLDKKSLKI